MSETPLRYNIAILGPDGYREQEVFAEPGGVVELKPGEKIISQDRAGGVPSWKRADISQAHFMRVQSIALNLANIVYNTTKDANIRAEIAELRRLLGVGK